MCPEQVWHNCALRRLNRLARHAELLKRMSDATRTSHGEELTVGEIAARTGLPARTVRYHVARWLAEGFPRVRRAQGQRGDARGVLLVSAADYEAMRSGVVKERAA